VQYGQDGKTALEMAEDEDMVKCFFDAGIKLSDFVTDEVVNVFVPQMGLCCTCVWGEQQRESRCIWMAQDLPWWREAIPKFIVRFESEIKQLEAKGSSWLTWSDYNKLAKSLEDGSVQASLQSAQMGDDVLFSHPAFASDDERGINFSHPAFASDDERGINMGQACDVPAEGPWTICLNLRVEGPTDKQGGRIMAKRAGDRGWELVVPRFNGPISFFANGSHVNVGSTRVDDGRWHHCAVSYDGVGVVRCYVDGRFDGEHAFGKIQPEPAIDLWIGSRAGVSPLVGGKFKHLIVFRRELYADELGTFATGEAAILKELFPHQEGPVCRRAWQDTTERADTHGCCWDICIHAVIGVIRHQVCDWNDGAGRSVTRGRH